MKRIPVAGLAAAIIMIACAEARGQGILTNGWGNSGAISNPGQSNVWSIAANSGDRITLQIAKLTGGAGFTPTIELFAPDQTRVNWKSGAVAARLDDQAAVSGTYTVVVSDVARSGTGTYRLQLAKIPAPFTVPPGDEGGALANGANQTGTIDVGDLDLWTLTANQGDRIALQVAELSGGAGFTPMIELFTPDGARLGYDSGAQVGRVDAQAPVGGTYTVLISDATVSGTGGYQLQLAQVSGAFSVPVGDEGGPLPDGVDESGSITLGDLDLWTFGASAGELVTLQMTELTGGANFTPKIELFAPNGERKSVKQDPSVATLTAAIEIGGSYTVLVSDATKSGAGTYALRLTRGTAGSAPGNILSNGVNYVSAIASVGETNFWIFSASAGESFVVRAGETVAGSPLIPWLRLYGPTGALLDSFVSGAAAEVTFRATNSGTFQVVISDGSSGHNLTGSYRISLAKTGSPLLISASDEGGPMVSGTTHSGVIDVGDLDAWTFTANAGESIVVRMGESTSGSALIPWLRLYGPDGVLMDNFASGAAAEVTLQPTNSGTFLVLVSDGSSGYTGSGNYRLNLAKTGSPLVISASDEGGPLINGTTYSGAIAVGDIDAWTLTANAGESIVVRMGETTPGSALIPWLRLYGPDGALLDTFASGATAEVTARATISGTFLVLAADGSSGYTGSGNYRLSLAKTGSPLVISGSDDGGPLVNGTTYLGTIDVGDIDGWTITANAGESIVVRMGETVSGSVLIPWLRLYGPDGALLDTFASGATAEVTHRATNNGTFLVVASDGSSGYTGSGNYRLSLAKTGSPLVISGSDEGGPTVNGTTYLGAIDVGDIDAWAFTANAGESIVVRMGETTSGSLLIPWLRLYGPNGALLDSFAAGAAAEVTFRATNSGTYLVVAADGSSGYTGSGNYRLSLAQTGVTSPVVISAGDEGGPMSNNVGYTGAITTGELDQWIFNVCDGDGFQLRLDKLTGGASFTPWVRLYGPDGTLLNSIANATTVQINRTAPLLGTYTVVISDATSGFGGAGTYQLTGVGVSPVLLLCRPLIQLPNYVIRATGGTPGAFTTILTTTNVDTPLSLWSPFRTNQYDLLGVFRSTNAFSTASPRQFFILRQ